MLKTLFSKIVVLFIAILLVSTSITGVMLYIFLGNFASEEKEKLLSDTADSINSMLNDYLTAYYNNYNNPMFAFWRKYTAECWITPLRGKVKVQALSYGLCPQKEKSVLSRVIRRW